MSQEMNVQLEDIKRQLNEICVNNELAAIWFATNIDIIGDMCANNTLPLEKMKYYAKNAIGKKDNLILMILFYKFMIDCDNGEYNF